MHVVADGLSPLTSLLQVLCSDYLCGESRWTGIRWLLLYVVLSIQMPNAHLLECSGLKSYDITKGKKNSRQALLKPDVHEGEKLHTYSLAYIQRICHQSWQGPPQTLLMEKLFTQHGTSRSFVYKSWRGGYTIHNLLLKSQMGVGTCLIRHGCDCSPPPQF